MRSRLLSLAVQLSWVGAGGCAAAGPPTRAATPVATVPTDGSDGADATPTPTTATQLFSVLAVDDAATPIDATTPVPAGAARLSEMVHLAGGVHERWYFAFPAVDGDPGARRRALDALSNIALPEGRRFAVGPGDAGALRSFVVVEPPVLVADDVAALREQQSEFGPVVVIELTGGAAQRFHRFTAEHVRTRVAIVVDGLVRSAPVVMEPISGGRLHLSLGADGNDGGSLEQRLRALRGER